MGKSSEDDALETQRAELEARISTLVRSTDAEELEQLVEAQLRSALTLVRLRRFEEALARAREAEATAKTAGRATWVATARISELTALLKLERLEEAYERVEGFSEVASELSNPFKSIRAFFSLCIVLYVKLGLEDQAAFTADKLLELPSADSVRERSSDAQALGLRAQIHLVRGRPEPALSDIGDAIALKTLTVSDSETDQIRLARLMVFRAWVLEELGRGDDASVVYSQIRSQFGDLIDIQKRARLQRAKLWHRRVHWLIRKDEIDELPALSRLIGEFGVIGDREAFIEMRDSLHDICGALGRAERYDDLLDASDGLIALLDQSSEPLDHGRATAILASKAMMLEALERPDMAADVERTWKGRVNTDTWAAMSEMAAQVTDKHSPIRAQQRGAIVLQRAMMLEKLEQKAEAIALLQDFQANFDPTELGSVTDLIALAERTLEAIRNPD